MPKIPEPMGTHMAIWQMILMLASVRAFAQTAGACRLVPLIGHHQTSSSSAIDT